MIELLIPSSVSKDIWAKAEIVNHPHAPFFTQNWHTLLFEVIGRNWQPWMLLVNKQIIAPFVHK